MSTNRPPTQVEMEAARQATAWMEPPPIAGQADREYQTRIEAQRCTLEFAQKLSRRLDAGKSPIEESPLFGGRAQADLFTQEAK